MGILDDLANAKPLNEYGEFIKEGDHVFALKEFGTKTSDQKGPIIFAELITVKSNAHKVGGDVGTVWLPVQTPAWKGAKDLSRAKAFVIALLGIEDQADDESDEDFNERVGKGANMLDQKAQPGKGIQVACRGKLSSKGKGDFVETVFTHIPDQSVEVIKATREAMESDSPAPKKAATPEAAKGGLLAQLGAK